MGKEQKIGKKRGFLERAVQAEGMAFTKTKSRDNMMKSKTGAELEVACIGS